MERKKPGRTAKLPGKRRIAWPRWTGFRGKTIWDWLQLLIVPLALAGIGLWFTMQQDARQQELESQRTQDTALQAYLDQMSQLLIENDLRNSEQDSEARTLARARTLSLLERLDADRKARVLRFLYEANLINSPDPVVSLETADLRSADLGVSTALVEAYVENHRDLEPSEPLPGEVNWGDVDLSGAYLWQANLVGTDLGGADLSGAHLLQANLGLADLSGANLSGAILDDAIMAGAEGITREQLDQASSLEGATMPDGQKYEDWLKSKGSGEAGENE